MKNFIFLLLFLMSLSELLAQKPRVKNDPTHDNKLIHFGFSLGLNFMDFSVYQSPEALSGPYYAGIKSVQPGINIQAISNLRLAENWDFRALPGISFGERNFYFYKLGVNTPDGPQDSMMYGGLPYRMELSFIELPLLFKYKAKRMNNFRPYFIGGGNLRYDLAVKKEYDYKEQLFMVKPMDFYLEVGTGFDFYLTYFKFGLELKYSIGMTNLFRSTNPSGVPPKENTVYTDMLSELKSHIFTISFHFE